MRLKRQIPYNRSTQKHPKSSQNSKLSIPRSPPPSVPLLANDLKVLYQPHSVPRVPSPAQHKRPLVTHWEYRMSLPPYGESRRNHRDAGGWEGLKGGFKRTRRVGFQVQFP